MPGPWMRTLAGAKLAAPSSWVTASGTLDFSFSDTFRTVWQQNGERDSPAPTACEKESSPWAGEEERKEECGISSFLSAVW